MRKLIYKHALKNAQDHGKANPKAVLGKVLAEKPELKGRMKELLSLIEDVVGEVNSLPEEKIAAELKGHEFVKRKAKKEGLPDLPGAEKGKVVLRFAPNPSGPLHIGHSRAAILNDEYAKRYDGKLILRIEDTDPRRVDKDAYKMIKEDLEWLGVEWHQEYIQSEHLEVYYDHARKLLEMDAAYVCTCAQEEFKELREARKPCPCRGLDRKKNVERFEDMFSEYEEGGAVVRLKTDLKHKNPSVRDFPIMRIADFEHPLAGGKKRIYPLMNFSVPVDDHALGMTHVLRGKDHLLNTEKQRYVYSYLGWKEPEFIHYGILKIGGVALSTSGIAKGIEEGEYSGWDDVRLGTLQALKRRGIQPGAIRKVMLDVGIKRVDIGFSWKNLYACNRELVEPGAGRYFFVGKPRRMVIEGLPKIGTIEIRRHPDHPEMGTRKLEVAAREQEEGIYVSGGDFDGIEEGDRVRLMGAFTVEVEKKGDALTARWLDIDLEETRQKGASFVQWVPQGNVRVEVHAPEGGVSGLGEIGLRDAEVGEVVQFERFGFVRIDKRDGKIEASFTHK